MPDNFRMFGNKMNEEAVAAELTHIRRLGGNENLVLAASNLGAYEALLLILQNGELGTPVYQAVANVRTPFSGPAGIINRLKALRRLGLLEEKVGAKRSQVCLAPSERLLRDIYPVLSARHYGSLQK